MKTRIVWGVLCCTMICTLRAAGAVSANDFDTANKLYAQGKFADAAAAYEKMIHSGAASPTLYFNLGDAYFKSSQIGRAIVAYRHAERMTPRDPDIRANLQFARNQVSGPTTLTSRWQRWLGELSLNEWTALAAAAFWLLFVLLAIGQFRPQLRRTLRLYQWCAALLLLIFGTGCGMGFVEHQNHLAVVIAPEATVRNGPFEESPDSFTAHDGAEFEVLDRKDDWLQVTDHRGRVGWLKSQSALLVPQA